MGKQRRVSGWVFKVTKKVKYGNIIETLNECMWKQLFFNNALYFKCWRYHSPFEWKGTNITMY